MAEAKTSVANKLAMSRALGAAFLTHQVEQLEKSVQSAESRTYSWRDRDGNNNNTQRDRKPSGRASAAAAKQRAPTAPAGVKLATRAEPPPSNGTLRARRSEDAAPPNKTKKQADIIVLDASVLVHAINQVKKWCRDGQEEILVVPLEALNTLDLLKKGTSTLAQRARAASRVLEAQVGTNARVRVQRDQAYVLWDTIAFSTDDETAPAAASPEWLRRTICCAQWEAVHAVDELPSTPEPKVVLAALAQPPAPVAPDAAVSPVPLPPPQAHKHEPRAAGVLVSHWARRSGLNVLELPPAPEHRRASSEEEHEREHGHNGKTRGGGGRRRNATAPAHANGPDGFKERGLVERPPAVRAMMDVVAQPSKVVRVLARGEKLEP